MARAINVLDGFVIFHLLRTEILVLYLGAFKQNIIFVCVSSSNSRAAIPSLPNQGKCDICIVWEQQQYTIREPFVLILALWMKLYLSGAVMGICTSTIRNTSFVDSIDEDVKDD